MSSLKIKDEDFWTLEKVKSIDCKNPIENYHRGAKEENKPIVVSGGFGRSFGEVLAEVLLSIEKLNCSEHTLCDCFKSIELEEHRTPKLKDLKPHNRSYVDKINLEYKNRENEKLKYRNMINRF